MINGEEWTDMKKKKKKSGYKSGPSYLVPLNIPGHVHGWSTACCSPDFPSRTRLQFCLGLVISIFSRSVSGTYRWSVASYSVSSFLLLLHFSFSSHHSFSRWLLFWTRSYLSIYYFTYLTTSLYILLCSFLTTTTTTLTCPHHSWKWKIQFLPTSGRRRGPWSPSCTRMKNGHSNKSSNRFELRTSIQGKTFIHSNHLDQLECIKY